MPIFFWNFVYKPHFGNKSIVPRAIIIIFTGVNWVNYWRKPPGCCRTWLARKLFPTPVRQNLASIARVCRRRQPVCHQRKTVLQSACHRLSVVCHRTIIVCHGRVSRQSVCYRTRAVRLSVCRRTKAGRQPVCRRTKAGRQPVCHRTKAGRQPVCHRTRAGRQPVCRRTVTSQRKRETFHWCKWKIVHRRKTHQKMTRACRKRRSVNWRMDFMISPTSSWDNSWRKRCSVTTSCFATCLRRSLLYQVQKIVHSKFFSL